MKNDIVSMPDILSRFINSGLTYISAMFKLKASYLDEETFIIHSTYSQLYDLCISTHTSNEIRLQIFILATRLTMLDIISHKEEVKEEIDAILTIDDEYKDFTPLQRLCYLDLKRAYPIYINRPFNTVLTFSPKIYTNTDDSNEIIEMYYLFANNVSIKKCKYCGHYFIPKMRFDSEYCNRIKDSESKPCDKIGPKRVYDQKKKNDLITKAHHKAYNRMRSKLRTNRINTKSDFCDWSDMATSMREECRSGEILFDEYQEWLDGDKV